MTSIITFSFEYQDGQFVQLPLLPNTVYFQAALALNNAGELVGYSDYNDPFHIYATLTRGQSTYVLNQLIDSADPLAPFVSVTRAYGINDSGWIVANGTDSRDQKDHVYLLKTKEPSFRWERINGGCPRAERED